MKIDNLSVDGFGVWKGLKVDGVSEHLTLFCGQNEAGKTTMMQYIRSMMFGFSPERLSKYTPPVYGGLAGGSLDVLTPTGTYEVQRFVDPNRHSDPIGDLTVVDGNDGSVHGRAQLNALMSDIDESIFNNVFAIGLREIQELGALNSTDAAEHLYKLTSGMDRVSLIDVMKDLRRRREEIWSSDPENDSKLSLLSVRRTKLLREIEDLKQRSKRWSRIAAEVTDVTHQLADIDVELEEVERESRLLEIAIQISERWQSRRLIEEQIAAFGTLPNPRDLSVEELDQCNARITQQRERIDQIKAQRKKIKQEALALPINRQLYAQKARIEAISEHSPWVESLERQVHQLQEEIEKIENGIVSEVDGLGSQLQIRAKDVKDLGNRGWRQLEDAAAKLTTELERMEKLKEELDKTEFDTKQVKDRIGSSFGDINPNESYEETSKQVDRLRRRIELEEKIDKLNRSRLGLERDIDSIVAEQVLPVNKLSIIGVAFIAGMILLGFGLLNVGGAFSDASTSGGLVLMICGLIAFFVSMGLKYHWEKIAKDELDDFRHQLEINRQQMRRSKHEREEIERQLPASGIGQWDMDLKDAEGRLMRLQDLAPMENRIQKSKAMAQEIRREIQTQERTIETVRGQWKASLRTAGLPDALQPHQLKEITARSERISTFGVRLEQLTSEKNQRQKELTALNQRINTMLYETGVQFKSNSLTDRLNQINSAINDQRSMVSARKELASKYKTLRTRLQKTKRELDKALGKRQRLLTSAGADTEEHYRQFDLKHKDRRKLMQKRDNLSEQIDAGLGAHYKQDDIAELMDAYGQSGLEKRWETVVAKTEELKANQANLQQQRGEFLQEVKTLGEDSRMDEARMELNVIDAKIGVLKKDWQKLAVSTQMLELIRETYESKRQPETLKEASNYLTQLTEDHYVRIWTRLTGEDLLVDNHEGETLPVDKLSRGTREAVYLSLRMALVGAYARRGAVIPMVLDDVLVNFDGRRTRAAAKVLCDFSRNGYQILMFTCHDHMRDLFHELGADVRILPEHKDVFEHQAKPTRFGDPVVPQHAKEDHETIVFENNVRQPAPAASFAPQAETFDTIPVEYVAPQRDSQIALHTDNYDAELEYELSAVVNDQHSHQRLRNELVYVTPNQNLPIDLSGNDAIWNEVGAQVVR